MHSLGIRAFSRVALHFEQAFFASYDNFEKRWIENIRVLSRTKECSLLFVAMGADFDYARPLDLAEEFGLKLTWVFAAPSSGRTPFVGLPTMRAAGPRLEQFLLGGGARHKNGARSAHAALRVQAGVSRGLP